MTEMLVNEISHPDCNSDREDADRRNPLAELAWAGARYAIQPLVHGDLSPPPTDYRPMRNVELEPDLELDIKTQTGEFPVSIFNIDALGDRSKVPDIVVSSSLAVRFRPEGGFVSPTVDALRRKAEEQERGLIVIAAPGSSGNAMKCKQLYNFSLSNMAEATHDVLDGIADEQQIELSKFFLTGGSLGGYISLAFADEEITGQRFEQGKPDHEVSTTVPIAPAGWKLRRHQQLRTLIQMSLLEPAHIVDKAAQMLPDERNEYLNSLRLTIPEAEAAAPIGKLALDFFFRGDLEDRFERIPKDLKIRAVAFDGDHVTLPHVLKKALDRGNFTDAELDIIDGRHLSLASFRKVMHRVVNKALHEDLEASTD